MRQNRILKDFSEIYRSMCFLKACDDGKCSKTEFVSYFELSRLSRKYNLFSTRFIRTAILFSFQICFYIFSEISPSSSRVDCLNHLPIYFSASFFNRVFVLRRQEYSNYSMRNSDLCCGSQREKRKMRQERKNRRVEKEGKRIEKEKKRKEKKRKTEKKRNKC